MKNKIPYVTFEKYKIDSPLGHIEHKFINKKSKNNNISFEITNSFFRKNGPIPNPTLITESEGRYKTGKNININNYLSQSKLYPSFNKDIFMGGDNKFQTYKQKEIKSYQDVDYHNSTFMRPFCLSSQSNDNKTFKKNNLNHKVNINITEKRYPSNYSYLESKYIKKKSKEKKNNNNDKNNNICFVDSNLTKDKSKEKSNTIANLSLTKNININKKKIINNNQFINTRYDDEKNNNNASIIKNEKSYDYYKIHKEKINTLVNSSSHYKKKNITLKSINHTSDNNNIAFNINNNQQIKQNKKISMKAMIQPRTPNVYSQNKFKFRSPTIFEEENQDNEFNEYINDKNCTNTDRDLLIKNAEKIGFKKLVFAQNKKKNIIKYKKKIVKQDGERNYQNNVTVTEPFRLTVPKLPATPKEHKTKNLIKVSSNANNNKNNNKNRVNDNNNNTYNNNVIVSINVMKDKKNKIRNKNPNNEPKLQEHIKSKTEFLSQKLNQTQMQIKDDKNPLNLKNRFKRRSTIQAIQILNGNKQRRFSTQNSDIVATVLNKIKSDNYNEHTYNNNKSKKIINDKEKEKEKKKETEKEKEKEKVKDNNKINNNNINNNNKAIENSDKNKATNKYKYNSIKKTKNNGEEIEFKEIEKIIYGNSTEPTIKLKYTNKEKSNRISNNILDKNDDITNKSLNLNNFSKGKFSFKEMNDIKNNKSLSDIKKCQTNNNINTNSNNLKVNNNGNNGNNENNHLISSFLKSNYYSSTSIANSEQDKKINDNNNALNIMKTKSLNNKITNSKISNNNLINNINSKIINYNNLNNNTKSKIINNNLNSNTNGNIIKNEESKKITPDKIKSSTTEYKKNTENTKKAALNEKKEKPANYHNISTLTINATSQKKYEKNLRYQPELAKHESRINEISKHPSKKSLKNEEEWDNTQYRGMRKRTYDAGRGRRGGKNNKNNKKDKKASGSLKDVFTATNYVKSSEGFSLAGKNDQGNKKTNQDTYVIERNVNGILNFNIFGVMDGHGDDGHFASQFVSRYVVHRIKTHPLIKKLDEPQEIYNALISNGYDIIANIYLDADIQIQKEKFDCTRSGTTIVLVIQLEEHIICANTGDSRAILIYDDNYDDNLVNSKIFLLSYDCKPELPEEKKRIYECGGVVEKAYYPDDEDDPIIPYRVWAKDEDYPGLAMSRSIGDMDAKKVGVIPNPQIVEYTIDYFSKYMLICSDGIWEFMKNEQAMKIGNKYYLRNDPAGLCHELTQESIKLWEKREVVIDDITVVVVFF